LICAGLGGQVMGAAVGVPGGAAGVAEFEAADSAEEPAALVAWTVKV